MTISLFSRQREILGQTALEPTVLAITLTAIAFVLLLTVCVAAAAFLPAFGYVWWAFGAIAVVLAWLLWPRRKPEPAVPSTGRQVWFRRILGLGRKLMIGLLVCWLGLIVWLTLCPGGPSPPPKADPALIRVLTWNIHCGQDEGPPWKRFDWRARKQPLRIAVGEAGPDILNVQEATPEQVAFLEAALPGHRRVGEGRDGGNNGEHCAIYFSRERFKQLDAGTFWLEEPIDQPRPGSAFSVKRICTWVRIRDRVSGRVLRVYNTHLPLTEAPRLTGSRIILAQIAAGDPTDAVLLTADFNAGPEVPSRRLFAEAGLNDTGGSSGRRTFQIYGIGISRLDGILIDSHWNVNRHHILDAKPHNTFPSDHFGVLADLALRH
jgi:endonuclease/exonuclease/phosphatase family metal-dependent hydrolase